MKKESFVEWWESLPKEMKKGDKKRAKNRFDAIVHAGRYMALQQALQAYVAEKKRESWRGWLYGTTFLARWEENLEDENRSELLVDEHPIDAHLCEVCEPAHEWKGREDLPYKATCPKQVHAMQMAIAGARLKGM